MSTIANAPIAKVQYSPVCIVLKLTLSYYCNSKTEQEVVYLGRRTCGHPSSSISNRSS